MIQGKNDRQSNMVPVQLPLNVLEKVKVRCQAASDSALYMVTYMIRAGTAGVRYIFNVGFFLQ